MSEPPKKEYRFKVIVVGTGGVGKTSIIKRFVNNYFSKNYKATVGVDFALKVMDVGNDTRVHLQLWDIAGQERFGSMTRIYYRDAVGAIIVFDLTKKKTFEAVETWKKDIEDKLDSEDEIPILLIGNKSDLLRDNPPCVEQEELQKYAEDQGFINCYRTSAKDNDNVNDAILFLMNKIIDNVKKNSGLEQQKENDTVVIKPANQAPASSGGCCGGSGDSK